LLQEGGTFIWTGFPKNLSTPYLEATTIGPYVISVQRIIVVVAALLIVGALLSFLQLTKTGKSMRALAANRQAAFLVGIDVPRTTTLAFIIGSCIGSISGALLGPLFMLIPVMGAGMNIKSLIVILFGGLGSIGGAMIGAYVLGMAESMFAGYLWLEWTGAVGYLMLIATLYLRPRGLFGKEQ
jgi:branched-chain amino acid transport system permease protein